MLVRAAQLVEWLAPEVSRPCSDLPSAHIAEGEWRAQFSGDILKGFGGSQSTNPEGRNNHYRKYQLSIAKSAYNQAEFVTLFVRGSDGQWSVGVARFKRLR
jgi:hypothetical protein